jgi:hypothetical protein
MRILFKFHVNGSPTLPNKYIALFQGRREEKAIDDNY